MTANDFVFIGAFSGGKYYIDKVRHSKEDIQKECSDIVQPLFFS